MNTPIKWYRNRKAKKLEQDALDREQRIRQRESARFRKYNVKLKSDSIVHDVVSHGYEDTTTWFMFKSYREGNWMVDFVCHADDISYIRGCGYVEETS